MATDVILNPLATRVAPICRELAQLADGSARPRSSEPPEAFTAAQATHWFQRNKYPLLGVADSAPDWLRHDSTFQRALAEEHAWYTVQHDEFAVVQRALLARGITGLMIKSAGNPPSFPYASDNIDLEVQPRYGSLARDTLRQLGYIELRTVEEPRKFLFRRFRGGQCVSAVHIHECVGWGVPFMNEAALWQRMQPAPDDPLVNIPSAEDAVLINLAHACYENKRFRLVDVARVRYVLRRANADLDWAYMERVAASRGWLDGLAFLLLAYAQLEPEVFGSALIPRDYQERLETIVAQDAPVRKRLEELRAQPRIDLPLSLSYWFCKRLYYRKVLNDPALSRKQRWRDVGATLAWGIKLKTHQRPQRGALISLSGPDGSGKTMHARALVSAMNTCGVRTDYLWSRGGSTGLLAFSRPAARLASQRRTRADIDPLTRRRQRLRDAGPLTRFAWSWLVTLDQLWVYAIRARLPTVIGRVVVTDRYGYDAAIDMDMALPPEARWSRFAITALRRLLPKPWSGYVLDVSPDVARQRRQELAAADIADYRQRYGDLAEQVCMRTLCTEASFADVNDQLLQQVITAYMAEFETWLNGVFRANPSQLNRPDPFWVR